MRVQIPSAPPGLGGNWVFEKLRKIASNSILGEVLVDRKLWLPDFIWKCEVFVVFELFCVKKAFIIGIFLLLFYCISSMISSFMVKVPHISTVMQKNHRGEVAISLNGKVVGIGKNSVVALKKAKKVMPDIEEKEFLVTRIHYKYIAV